MLIIYCFLFVYMIAQGFDFSKSLRTVFDACKFICCGGKRVCYRWHCLRFFCLADCAYMSFIVKLKMFCCH